MKIAILSRYQKLHNRGVESFASELSSRLAKNHQVDLLIGKQADDISKIIKGNYDIVMPLNGRLQSLKVSLSRLFSKYQLVIGGHSGIGRDDIWNIAVCKPDIFIALTKKEYDFAKGWAWGSKVVKIPNGVNLDRFSSHGKKIAIDLPKPIILSVGALEWYKGHEKVIRAVAKLDSGSLLIVGKGSLKTRLQQLGEELLPSRFKVIEVPYDKMPEVYRVADIFTLASWDREAFGIVYLEAMACNIPVVAPNDDSRQEIIGLGGLLTEVDNPTAFSKSLEQALQTNFKDRPRQHAEKFSWEIIAKKYETELEKLIN